MSFRKPSSTVAVAFLLFAAGGSARSDPAPAADRKADVEAIRESADQFSRAFENGNAKALADQWTDSGEYYSDAGPTIRGRENIEKSYAELFEKAPKHRVEVQIESIRFPSRDLAVEEGVLLSRPKGRELPRSTRYSAVHIREDGCWKTAIVREHHNVGAHLAELAWLVGQWKSINDGVELQMKFEWNVKRTFLIVHYTMLAGGKAFASGMQRIGVDPRTGLIHSWQFGDDGSAGQARWRHEGVRWVMQATETSPDGKTTTCVHILSRIDDDEFAWQTIDRVVDGVRQEDAKPMKIVRVGRPTH